MPDASTTPSSDITASAKQELARWVSSRLRHRYPQVRTALAHNSAFELLVATVLAAQAPDVRVNQVTPVLFARWGDAHSLATASPEEIDAVITSLPLHTAKARNLSALAAALVERHGGEVPASLDELVALPGVGRKTAQVVLGAWFSQPAFPVDTHTSRLVVRLGLAPKPDPVVVEDQVRALLPDDALFDFHLRLVEHGRDTCQARKPACSACVLAERCPSAG